MAAASKRIPLAGPYNTRVSAVNAADTSSGYAGVGIAGLMIAGKTTTSVGKDARYVNCFAETVSDPITGAKKIYAVKRPGFGTQSTPAAGKKGFARATTTPAGTTTPVTAVVTKISDVDFPGNAARRSPGRSRT
jgi:hypothetical protein